MKKCITIILAALMLFSFAACEGGDDVSDFYDQYPVTSGGDILSGGDAAVEGGDAQFGNVLPEDLICTWEVIDIYQESPISEISADVALDKERKSGMLFGFNTFSRSSDYIEDAVFSINFKATYDEMYQYFGIQTESLSDQYGADAEVISIAVSTSDGMPCTTVYIIDRSVLLAFGAGMNVFTYRMVESVG
ncbi:MAG: hypothetical protein IJC18_00070 [Clostridia bacterium]|nr:hypothetical protein [Clostridia bacterium]MBQ9994666.1 hypothetical protein [Clostridia bacterium]